MLRLRLNMFVSVYLIKVYVWLGGRLRIGIESKYVDARMNSLDQHNQAATAAANVENAVTWPNGRLIEESPPGRITTERLHEWVVER